MRGPGKPAQYSYASDEHDQGVHSHVARLNPVEDVGEPAGEPGRAVNDTVNDPHVEELPEEQADVIAARKTVPNPTDLVNSQTAGTCYLCHDSDPAVAHMGQNGGVILGWRAEALGD